VCRLVPFYGLLLFSCDLSSSVFAKSEFICFVVLILSTVACVVVKSIVTYGFLLICAEVTGFWRGGAVVDGLLSLCKFHFLRG